MQQVFVTLLSSDDYLKPVLILNTNLKQLNSKYPLLVMVTDNITQNTINYLQKENILYTIVPQIEYSEQIKIHDAGKSVLNTASKLNIFDLKQYDKIVYFDADCIFLSNIDDLFNYPDGAMYDNWGYGMGFSALFVCCPNYHYSKYYITLIKNYNIWDGQLLGELWFPYRTNKDYHIPYQYFINITRNFNSIPMDLIKGIHFIYKYKPWEYNNVEEYLKDFSKEIGGPYYGQKKILNYYFNNYLFPLKEKYPELF